MHLVFISAFVAAILSTSLAQFGIDIAKADWLENFKQLSAWGDHGIFANWLVKLMKPNLIVDLGVDYGYSTFIWSKSLAAVNVNGKVIGIDSFYFDVGNGIVRDNYRTVMNIIQNGYGDYLRSNIEIIKGYFDEVAKSWNRNKVDILQVDGRHEYENVTADYHIWKHIVQEDGVVLFHDCYVWDQEKFGVYKLFNEITEFKFKGYFESDSGLGVATNNQAIFTAIVMNFPKFIIGSNIIPPIEALPSYFEISELNKQEVHNTNNNMQEVHNTNNNMNSIEIITPMDGVQSTLTNTAASADNTVFNSTGGEYTPVNINNTRIIFDFNTWEANYSITVYTKHIIDNIVLEYSVSINKNWKQLFHNVINNTDISYISFIHNKVFVIVYSLYIYML